MSDIPTIIKTTKEGQPGGEAALPFDIEFKNILNKE